MNKRVQRVRRALDAPFRVVGNEVIVAPPNRDDFTVLSGTAVAVWELLDVPRTRPELAGLLAERFGAGADVVERDVRQLLDGLRSIRCVEVDGG